MKFKLEIACDNDAFDLNLPGYEIARILRDVAGKIELSHGATATAIRDINGNTVGHYSLTRRTRK